MHELVLHEIEKKIYTIRGVQVMLDSDLADLYQVETRRLNEQVKRNIKRFPQEFMFRLTQNECDILMSQNATSSSTHGGRRKAPFVFTEQGVSMLSTVLKSDTAVDVSIKIIKSFVAMRKVLVMNAGIFQRLDTLERKQIDTDEKLDRILDAIEDRSVKPKQGIFYDGQIFDAYVFVSGLIKSAEQSIVLIDNYVDESVLAMLNKRVEGCSATIYTRSMSKTLKLDLEKHNAQYPAIDIKLFADAHDRFLILDDADVYHIGASLKDLGKKWFAFSKMERASLGILEKLS